MVIPEVVLQVLHMVMGLEHMQSTNDFLAEMIGGEPMAPPSVFGSSSPSMRLAPPAAQVDAERRDSGRLVSSSALQPPAQSQPLHRLSAGSTPQRSPEANGDADRQRRGSAVPNLPLSGGRRTNDAGAAMALPPRPDAASAADSSVAGSADGSRHQRRPKHRRCALLDWDSFRRLLCLHLHMLLNYLPSVPLMHADASAKQHCASGHDQQA